MQADVQKWGVREACRIHGIHHATWYRWAAQADAPAPLESTNEELRQTVLALIRECPHWGCDRIAFYLQRGNLRVSSPTVQRILVREGLGKRDARIQYAKSFLSTNTHAKGDSP